jgi:hypothetical protein
MNFFHKYTHFLFIKNIILLYFWLFLDRQNDKPLEIYTQSGETKNSRHGVRSNNFGNLTNIVKTLVNEINLSKKLVYPTLLRI